MRRISASARVPNEADAPPLPPPPPPVEKKPADNSPTMLLPVIVAIQKLTLGKMIAGAVGVLAILVVGVGVLVFAVPADGKQKAAPKPTPPPVAASPTLAAVKHTPVTELCGRFDTAGVLGLYPTAGTPAPAAAPGIGCTVTLEFKPPATSPPASPPPTPAPSLHRTGAIQATVAYFASSTDALVSYGAKIGAAGTTGIGGVGGSASAVATAPGAGRTATVQVYTVDDNALLTVVFTANREDRAWTPAELAQLQTMAATVTTATLAKL